ncbi:MAG: hypothetical protein HOK88_07200 [Candidatus Marinimicrobia bacterium]|nr:hypothetical protein [Candidatus Neomarinimicrobiota bacterium]
MRKISLLVIILTTFASAQLRVGLDFGGGVKQNFLGIMDIEQNSKLGFTVGYEKTLFGIAGVGAEYVVTQVGDAEMKSSASFLGESASDSETTSDKMFPNVLKVYGLARVPLGVPFLRGVVRAGMFVPLGSTNIEGDSYKWDDVYKTGLTWGVGVRAKLPVFPFGVELLYQSMKLDSGSEIDLFGEGDDDEGGMLFPNGDFTNFTLAVTYSF